MASSAFDETSSTGRFVHLHCHSEYSLLDGFGKLSALVQAAVNDGQTAMAQTDHGSLDGAFKFRNACLEAGIKPIIGMEAYLAIGGDRFNPQRVEVPRDDDSAVDADADGSAKGTKTKANEHLTILSTSPRGWRNLVSIHNEAQKSFKGKPLADYNLLAEHAEDLICLTGCLGGPVAGPVSRGDLDEARVNLQRLVDTFGKGNVYVEIMYHGIDSEKKVIKPLRDLAFEFGLKLVATNDCHYPEEGHEHPHEAWLAVQSGKPLGDPKAFSFNGSGYWAKSADEMLDVFPGNATWAAACAMTTEIADRCCDDPFEGLTDRKLPKFNGLPEGKTSTQHLKDQVRAGAVERYGSPLPRAVKDRLRDELNIVAEQGVDDYFLIGQEMVDWARENGIATGRGRGSAGGFASSYCLGLTGVDPLKYGLLAERFLERGRTDLPDIDYDFEAGRRDEVLAHLADVYGETHVARIGTFGMSRSRRAIKDAARVLGSKSGDLLSKKVPVEGGKPLKFKALLDPTNDKTKPFREAVESIDDAEAVVALAQTFEGVVNGNSIHACGTVVSSVPLNDLIPLRYERKGGVAVGIPVACWDGGDIEKFGLLKLDVLGLNNLDRVSAALRMIEESTGESMTIDSIPDPDGEQTDRVLAAWEMLADGNASGVFQLDSAGMRDLIMGSQPNCLDDLSAVLALYRPGPMSAGAHDDYADRKSGVKKKSYSKYTNDKTETEWIDSVLGDTHGLVTYQEQLMRLGTVVAGFDAAGRSKLRKAVGKKIEELMIEVGEAFIAGAETEVLDANGEIVSPVFSQSTAQALWNDIKGAGEYAFNKSHSTTYGALSFINAYLKANWPVQYGAAVLSMTPKDVEKRKPVLDSLDADGIEVCAPLINSAPMTTSAVGDKVVLGLSEIRDVGSAAAAIIAERDSGGAFTSLHDLMSRVQEKSGADGVTRGLSSKAVEALIEAGALDEFGPRAGLMAVMLAAKDVDLEATAATWGVLESAARQRHRLGVSVGKSPLATYKTQLSEWKPDDVPKVIEKGRLTGLGAKAITIRKAAESTGGNLTTIGILTAWKVFPGSRASFTLEGGSNAIPMTMWARDLGDLANNGPQLGDIVAVFGQTESRKFMRETTNEDGETVETETERVEFKASRLWVVDVKEPVDEDEDGQEDAPVIDFMAAKHRLSSAANSQAPDPVEDETEVVEDEDDPFAEPSAPTKPKTAPARVNRTEPTILRVRLGTGYSRGTLNRSDIQIHHLLSAAGDWKFDPLILETPGILRIESAELTEGEWFVFVGDVEMPESPTWEFVVTKGRGGYDRLVESAEIAGLDTKVRTDSEVAA